MTGLCEGFGRKKERVTVLGRILGTLLLVLCGCLLVLLLISISFAEATCPPVHRSRAVVRHFMRQTGFPRGRSGYVVDHVLPLCAGGMDAVSNLQWQALATSRVKDRQERAQCHALWNNHARGGDF